MGVRADVSLVRGSVRESRDRVCRRGRRLRGNTDTLFNLIINPF